MAKHLLSSFARNERKALSIRELLPSRKRKREERSSYWIEKMTEADRG